MCTEEGMAFQETVFKHLLATGIQLRSALGSVHIIFYPTCSGHNSRQTSNCKVEKKGLNP